MIKYLKLVVSEIRQGENLDLYVTVLLAIVIGILSVIGTLPFEVVSAVILATLGLLANSFLSNRRATDALSERLALLDEISSGIRGIIEQRTPLDELFRPRDQLPPLDEQLADAQSIDMCGMSLLSISTRYRKMLLSKIERGCRIRLLLLNPYDKSLMQMISPFIGSLSVAAHTQAILTSLDCFVSDSDFFNSELVQVRLYNYPLAHGMMIVNRDASGGRLRVENYMSNSMPADAPGFYIRKDEDSDWFAVFCTEFEDIWANATPYCPQGEESTC